ncbi:MAG TPA: SRPBCC family protein [Solirubrobacteraceae bacterium]|nr:SRPBCC family protein [Solirubrobacteraceae bacterium]
MGSICKVLELDVAPEAAWDAVRDWGAVHTRLASGFAVDTEIDGNDRVVTFGNGMVQREPLVDLDDDARRLVYSAVDSPIGASHYNGCVEVSAGEERASRLVWRIDFLPNEVAAGLDAAMELGAQAMRRTLEGSAVSAER